MSGSPREYSGREAVVTHDGKRRMHAAACVPGLPSVFDPNAKPWISSDAAPGAKLAELVARCPTGALHRNFRYRRAPESVPVKNEAKVCGDRPVYLRGKIDELGELLLQGTRIALCRCGASKNRPFRDGSHTRIGFKA